MSDLGEALEIYIFFNVVPIYGTPFDHFLRSMFQSISHMNYYLYFKIIVQNILNLSLQTS